MITVVIPCFNSSKTIGEALESVYKQVDSDSYEVIVIDDNSLDVKELVFEVNKFKHCFKRLELICNTINVGGGAARNEGIKRATGRFICFLDADDIWLESKISIQLNSYQHGAILTSAVLKGRSIKSSEILPKVVKPVVEKVSNSLFLYNRLIQTSTFFMSADIAKEICFNPLLPRHQDYDFLLRAESAGYHIIQDEKPLSFWRVEDSSSGRFLKKKASPEFFINWFRDYRKYMTRDAAIAYVSKNIFSACLITKEIALFSKFFFSNDFSNQERFRIMLEIVSWRIKKIKYEK
ncbi:glycosyltransferase family 2 protein [Aeromonas salmonicida]|uniref:glycosyltransferase family 2 protein n=1 Tax=Aeromonas salmonicida TaxID=645 RepID=UPI003D1D47E4